MLSSLLLQHPSWTTTVGLIAAFKFKGGWIAVLGLVTLPPFPLELPLTLQPQKAKAPTQRSRAPPCTAHCQGASEPVSCTYAFDDDSLACSQTAGNASRKMMIVGKGIYLTTLPLSLLLATCGIQLMIHDLLMSTMSFLITESM